MSDEHTHPAAYRPEPGECPACDLERGPGCPARPAWACPACAGDSHAYATCPAPLADPVRSLAASVEPARVRDLAALRPALAASISREEELRRDLATVQGVWAAGVEANTSLQRELAEARRELSEARASAIELVRRVLGRIVFTDVAGLEGLTLQGAERDEWIVRTTARKVLGLVESQLRLLSSPPRRSGGRP